MTNTKNINLDNLITLLNDNTELLTTGYDNAVDVLIQKIKELVTPAHEPQESIYDAGGWCWDLSKIPKTNNLKMGVFLQSEPVLLFYKGDCFVEKVNFTVDGEIAENQDFYKAECWKPLTLPTGGKND